MEDATVPSEPEKNARQSRPPKEPGSPGLDLTEMLKARIKRKNKILFRLDDALLSDLSTMLESSSRKAVVIWAFNLAEEGIRELDRRCPGDDRARESLQLSKAWARGDIKMPKAKSAILSCHNAAKETEDEVCAAIYHAIGQACGCVHTPGHALGCPIYELTAIVRELGVDSCEKTVRERVAEYEAALVRANKNALSHPGPWAGFLDDAQ